MNDDFHDIEKELKTLIPRPLSERARQRIAEEIGAETRVIRMNWGMLALKIAAAILVLMGSIFAWTQLAHKQTPGEQPQIAAVPVAPPAESNSLAVRHHSRVPVYPQPVSYDTMLVRQQDEGPCVIHGTNPMRRIRYHFVDNVEWYDHQHQRTTRRTTPREEEVLVSLPVY